MPAPRYAIIYDVPESRPAALLSSHYVPDLATAARQLAVRLEREAQRYVVDAEPGVWYVRDTVTGERWGFRGMGRDEASRDEAKRMNGQG